MNTQAVISAIVSEGGFDIDEVDTSRTAILGWVQARYDLALSRTKYRKLAVELGPTVAGQATYALPAHVVDLMRLRVDGSKPWLRISGEDMWYLRSDAATYLRQAAGAFAPQFEADADQVVELYPAPDRAGLAIDALCAAVDTTQLTDASGSTASLPADLHRALLVKGGIAEGLTTVEKRPDIAASFEAEFGEAMKELGKRAKSRVGTGVWQARVNGR